MTTLSSSPTPAFDTLRTSQTCREAEQKSQNLFTGLAIFVALLTIAAVGVLVGTTVHAMPSASSFHAVPHAIDQASNTVAFQVALPLSLILGSLLILTILLAYSANKEKKKLEHDLLKSENYYEGFLEASKHKVSFLNELKKMRTEELRSFLMHLKGKEDQLPDQFIKDLGQEPRLIDNASSLSPALAKKLVTPVRVNPDSTIDYSLVKPISQSSVDAFLKKMNRIYEKTATTRFFRGCMRPIIEDSFGSIKTDAEIDNLVKVLQELKHCQRTIDTNSESDPIDYVIEHWNIMMKKNPDQPSQTQTLYQTLGPNSDYHEFV